MTQLEAFRAMLDQEEVCAECDIPCEVPRPDGGRILRFTGEHEIFQTLYGPNEIAHPISELHFDNQGRFVKMRTYIQVKELQ